MSLEFHSLDNAQIEEKERIPTNEEILRMNKKQRKPYVMKNKREIWTPEEHELFLEGLSLYKRDWKRIEQHVKTKTVIQIRSHAQKYFIKEQKQHERSLSNDRTRSGSRDNSTETSLERQSYNEMNEIKRWKNEKRRNSLSAFNPVDFDYSVITYHSSSSNTSSPSLGRHHEHVFNQYSSGGYSFSNSSDHSSEMGSPYFHHIYTDN